MTKRVGYVDHIVTRVDPEETVHTGVQMHSFQYLVPFYEEHAVRQGLGYTLDQWLALDHMERAIEVAVRRIRIASEAHEADAQNRAMNKG